MTAARPGALHAEQPAPVLERSPDPAGWSIDAAPRARLGLLFVLFTLPVMLVAARLVWLQVIIPDRFVAAWTQTRETFETIPASDGRIESIDGQVLAFDQPSYAIHVHYRWLEEPVDPAWLKAVPASCFRRTNVATRPSWKRPSRRF